MTGRLIKSLQFTRNHHEILHQVKAFDLLIPGWGLLPLQAGISTQFLVFVILESYFTPRWADQIASNCNLKIVRLQDKFACKGVLQKVRTNGDKELQHSQNHRVMTYDFGWFWWWGNIDDMFTSLLSIKLSRVCSTCQALCQMFWQDVVKGSRLRALGLLGTWLLDGVVAAE